jgi:UDP-N-acetylmuramate dehydrogenase
MSAALPLSVRLAEPLARHTALRTGGACDAYVVAYDVAGVAEVVAECRKAGWKLMVLGAGTRVVFREGPVPGVVLRLGGDLGHVVAGDEGTWEVGAATPLPVLVHAAAAAGLKGMEDRACVPGSFGASLLWDEAWDVLVRAVFVLRRGALAETTLEDARRKRPIVLGARLGLETSDPAAVAARTAKVWAKQTPAPCGSWYEKGGRTPVRSTLRASRLQMVRLREVAIPDLAPELLVNLGGGTAADLALLHKSAIERVARIQGEELSSRVKWIGQATEERWESDTEESASSQVG